MTAITSHLLNGLDGTHAGGVSALLRNVTDDKILATSKTDQGGRLSIDITALEIDPAAQYELVFDTAPYWRERGHTSLKICPEIVLRFFIPDPDQPTHMPVIISPYSYSTWKSH